MGQGPALGGAAAADALKKAQALGVRFSGGQGSTQRNFL